MTNLHAIKFTDKPKFEWVPFPEVPLTNWHYFSSGNREWQYSPADHPVTVTYETATYEDELSEWPSPLSYDFLTAPIEPPPPRRREFTVRLNPFQGNLNLSDQLDGLVRQMTGDPLPRYRITHSEYDRGTYIVRGEIDDPR